MMLSFFFVGGPLILLCLFRRKQRKDKKAAEEAVIAEERRDALFRLQMFANGWTAETGTPGAVRSPTGTEDRRLSATLAAAKDKELEDTYGTFVARRRQRQARRTTLMGGDATAAAAAAAAAGGAVGAAAVKNKAKDKSMLSNLLNKLDPRAKQELEQIKQEEDKDAATVRRAMELTEHMSDRELAVEMVRRGTR